VDLGEKPLFRWSFNPNLSFVPSPKHLSGQPTMRAALRLLLVFSFSILHSPFSIAQSPFPGANQRWVDSVFNALTLDEKIGQLLMPRANFRNEPYDREKLLGWVREYKVGGFVFFANQPTRQAVLTNELQAASRTPLLIGSDLEWGLTMRLDSTTRYPYAMTLGATPGPDTARLYKMGRQIGQQVRRLGVHVNYAPDADVNNNPNNPVINFRSFGENKRTVLAAAAAYMRGMQDERVITSAKHFPGHGDTDVDSHADLPVIRHDRARLDSVELYPFRELIKRGLNGVMIAHLSIPALDTTRNLPTTLSRHVVTDLLRNELGFQGLIFTDAMEMQGVVKYFPNGEAAVRALLAGNDIVETFTDVPGTFNAIKYAVAEGRLPLADLNAKVRRILTAKAWAGLDRYQPVKLDGLLADLNPGSADLLARDLTEDALTLVQNANNRLPIRELSGVKIATLSLNSDQPTAFQQMADHYAPMDHFTLPATAADSTVRRVKSQLAGYDLVLVGIHGLGIRPAATIKPEVQALVNGFGTLPNAVFALFGNPYTLNRFTELANAPALLVAYQETPATQELAAQAMFGATGVQGRLPVTVNERYRQGAGLTTEALGRFKYTRPEEVGIDSRLLATKLDSIVNQGLAAKAYPGASVLVARDGKVIFEKTYGQQTYGGVPVSRNDLYDLASVTKVSTSVPALMKLQDEGKFHPDMTLGELYPKFRRSNKANLKLIDILTHQSGLKAWIPFWRNCVDSTTGGWKRRTFSTERSRRYPIEVADNLFLHRRYEREIFRQIRDSPVKPGQGYVYSDLSYYLYPQVIKRLTGQNWEEFLKKNFYGPLGAGTLTYNARRHFPLSRIVPTEYDSLFRKTLIHGRVHDEGAAMLDGISGHAGLFGTANDLAKLMQMYLNYGTYGGQRYIQEATLKQWTGYPFPVEVNARRGIGFDKPDRRKPGLSGPSSASPLSFGHSGFTGTFVWMDPAQRLLYVFLSNRVYPTRGNNKISQLNIRTQFGEVIYEAIRQSRGMVF
jgi:beta-glucosidase-like glycosyl hydrolase/CubicO group peptidase (beta-lactamase class C family)